jgi:hypothetical protein
MFGNSGTVQIAFLDGEGRSIGEPRNESVAAFAALELADAVPFGAVMARIENTSETAAIGGYAMVADASGHLFVVTDTLRSALPPSDAHVIPMLPPRSGDSVTRQMYIANDSGAAADVTIEALGGPSRRRAVSASFEATPLSASSLTVQPSQTAMADLGSGLGYSRLTAAAGVLTFSGRLRTGSTTTALTAAPVTNALGFGEQKRFLGIDDASQAAVDARRAGALRSSLALVETSGDDVTTRVTLRATLPSSGKASAEVVVSREVSISANRMIVLSDLALAVIGPGRATLGDLRSMQLDVEVVSGSGHVMPFVQSIDYGTGELALRAD